MPAPTEPRTAWGRRVRERRLALGLDQAALAERTGFSQPTISDIESGRTTWPSDRTKVTIATALEATVAELFPYDEIPAAS